MDLLNALVALANYVIIPGLAYGSQLALGALGITLIYGVLRFSNFAHGDTMAFGATLSILGTWWLQSMGISFGVLPTALLALPFSILGCIALILFTDRTVYRFYRVQKAKPVIFLIVSMGVMFIMNGVVRFIIGPDDRTFSDGQRFIMSARGVRHSTSNLRASRRRRGSYAVDASRRPPPGSRAGSTRTTPGRSTARKL